MDLPMESPENKLPLKVLVDSKRNKVLFAETGSDFVDVLLSFLTLPLGTITRRLNQHFGGNTEALGCFSNLYSSVENLSDSDFVIKEERYLLLYPKNASQTEWLKLKIDDSELTQYYKCTGHSKCALLFSIDRKAKCPFGNYMNPAEIFISSKGRVFTDSRKTFIITDDLRVMPSLDGLNFEPIQHLVFDVHEFEEKIINVGFNEIMLLLKWSLISPTPLTNLLLWQDKTVSIRQPYFGTWAPQHERGVQTEDSKKMVIKALVQKSTKMLLFFLAGVDFVGFLFKLLQIPLGSVESLSGGKSGLRNIDNLFTSISEMSSEYFVSPKESLINPKVVHSWPIRSNLCFKFLCLSEKPGSPDFDLELMDLMGDDEFIERTSTFMVADNLTVTPLTSMSIIVHLHSRKIRVSDVKELSFNIGTNEALDILKASLTSSTSAISDALQLTEQLKEEK